MLIYLCLFFMAVQAERTCGRVGEAANGLIGRRATTEYIRAASHRSRLTSHLNGVVQKEAVELSDGPFAAGQTEHILILLLAS
jgi:hypothetical protein